jgi:hypothetical protein
MVKKIDEHEAIPFLKAVFKNCEDGMLNLRFLPKGRNEFININEVDQIPKILSRDSKQNAYFGVALRSGPDGTKKGIYLIPVLWLEHDNVTPENEEWIRGFPLPPSIMVQTSLPTKRHYYWSLKEPLSKEEILKVEDINRRIANYFGGDLNACDASRILRLPGTLNFKYNPPLLCKVLEINDRNQYQIEDFEIFPSMEVSKPSVQKNWQDDLLPGVSKGERNQAASRLVRRYLGRGLSVGEILDLLVAWNLRNSPPLDELELRSVIESVKKTHDRKRAKREGEAEKSAGPVIESSMKGGEVYPLEKDKLPEFPREAWVGIGSDYYHLFHSSTEAPEAFHFGSITTLSGLLLGRKFYIRHPRPVYQNYYFLVVGESGFTHKGTAIGYGMDISEAMGEKIRYVKIFVSTEGIFHLMSKEEGTRVLLVNDELRNLLANTHRLGTQNILANLCTLYDLPKCLSIGQKDLLEIKNGMFSMISAITTESMSQREEVESVTGGFIGRNILLAGELKGPIADPIEPGDDLKNKFIKGVIKWRKQLPEEGGEIIKGKAAMRIYTDYYSSWWREVTRSEVTSRLLRNREALHAMKLSGMFALQNTRMEIGAEDVERAIAVINHSSACQSIIFKDITLSMKARLQMKLMDFLRSGPKTRREINRGPGRRQDAEDVTRALRALRESEEIEEGERKNPHGPRSKVYYLPAEED